MSVDYSIVSYHGEMNGSRCGYCKNTRSSNSHGMTSHVLTIHDYQDLIDRGWRRSGNYCYKPSNNTTCCPSYTIKCESLSFKLSKSNKKILKKVSKYLKDGLRDKEEEKRAENGESSEGGHRETEFLLSKDKEVKVISRKDLPVKEANPVSETVTKSQVDNPGSTSKESESPEATSSGTKSPCKKAKQLRIERKQAKLALRGEQMDLAPKSQKCPEKSLEDFLNESNQPNAAHKLEVKLYLSSTKAFFQKFGQTEYKLYQKYQTSIHGESPENIDEFYQFLVHSPLQFDDVPGTNGQMKFGSFHQQYWLDGKLIAVGVIDILPSCVSSVYFFYDPDYSFLSLGTYGSLKEMAFVRELQKTIPNLKYYYMGFYIHSCPKMRYKAKLHPSLLLCPEIYSWHSIDEKLLKKLDESKYQRFNEDPNAIEVNKFGRENLKLIPTYNGGKPVLLEELLRTQKSTPDLAMILEYASLVGASCARRIILYLN